LAASLSPSGARQSIFDHCALMKDVAQRAFHGAKILPESLSILR
jgi:hypothetical protein